jgi:hypothetical protein
MQTLPKITRRTTRVEFSSRELLLIDAAMFDGMVRLLKDSKSFDISEPDDDVWNMEARTEADTIRNIQNKINFALKQIELDSTQ